MPLLFSILVALAAAPAWGICTQDSDCNDGLFCNGAEYCMPGNPQADGEGCVAGTNPCQGCGSCDEGLNLCTSCGCSNDLDGDGHIDIACGGDDCDDADAARYPGNSEICDAYAHDEDCDPSTYGERDADGDRWIDAQCCNQDSGGHYICGPDCNDGAPGVNPAAPEVCDGVDNDCDGVADEGLKHVYYQDLDRDGWGNSATSVNACWANQYWSIRASDCNDSVSTIHPGAVEVCNGVDDDCDGLVDEGFPAPCP